MLKATDPGFDLAAKDIPDCFRFRPSDYSASMRGSHIVGISVVWRYIVLRSNARESRVDRSPERTRH